MLLQQQLPEQDALQRAITDAYLEPEVLAIEHMLSRYPCTQSEQDAIQSMARELVLHVQEQESNTGGMEAFMRHYDLSSDEGVMMMCLAEALLRIPDKDTEDLLIRDKLTSANWQRHIGLSHSSFVNMTTWGLALTGKVLDTSESLRFSNLWQKMIKRSGEPVIRSAVRAAIQLLSKHFVLGRSIEEAVTESKKMASQGYSFSYDMLGEAACTQDDAQHYFEKYQHAIREVGRNANTDMPLQQRSGVSIKLSALYPRYEWLHRTKCVDALSGQLHQLAQEAKKVGIPLTMDAEEADRLEMSLEIFEKVYLDDSLDDWAGLGLAVQAYQKRAFSVIEWLAELAKRGRKTIAVRLVKGAYWDTEIKQAQMKGLPEYPVFTRKPSTDLNYIVCAHRLLSSTPYLYPQFATHNAYTAASILVISQTLAAHDFEFQALQGMGQSLHNYILADTHAGVSCRIYAPVGVHEDLLPYLVRRLLENGANSSFVNQLARSDGDIDSMIVSVFSQVEGYQSHPRNPHLPLPRDIFPSGRLNAPGIEWSDQHTLATICEFISPYGNYQWHDEKTQSSSPVMVTNPANPDDIVGSISYASQQDVEHAVAQARKAFLSWSNRAVDERADILEAMADILVEHQVELLALLIREAGKTAPDALTEWREAIDFCRYYAEQARSLMSVQVLHGYTGETNTLRLCGRGAMVCISPWNFPLAIFVGQVVAALVTGNTVLAKPAEQASLVARRVVDLLYQAGIPKDVLHCLPGTGEAVGVALTQDSCIAGVLFTGSNDAAKHIQRTLAQHDGPILPLIAETGGLNAMLVDSSALPEQTIRDVIDSAFGSAGQRCSACRILLLQEDIADAFIAMLKGAMAELVVGDPRWLNTDIGPVIDAEAKAGLSDHQRYLDQHGQLIFRVEKIPNRGTFVAPQVYEINDLSMLQQEAFGPILHVVRYQRDTMFEMIKHLNALGYGLTFGVQSRIEDTVAQVISRVHAGNIYVNRNTVGAIVGLQPFGGMGLSGTGPKAGGPYYLQRLCHEVTVSTDTTAAGGNASLMAMEE
ncbi:MAG: bifunctional proline dehydrogenase/L-glutamate gamma-semialdehyde dehydrogenase [Coxiellaceae bacterium]|nr:bifunctional proline dehydrogenase/L-glutamate gamma-semialdehyde dehydrogenase [Coxiellaceae bacterium]